MNDGSHSLVPVPDSSLASPTPGAKRIVSAIVGETLALIRCEEVKKAEDSSSEPNVRDVETRLAVIKFAKVLIGLEIIEPVEFMRALITDLEIGRAHIV